MEQAEEHTLSIENRKRINATKIEAVSSFSASQIVLLCNGGKIVVSGSDMKITAFSKSSGQFTAQGNIDGVKYSNGSSGLKGLFK